LKTKLSATSVTIKWKAKERGNKNIHNASVEGGERGGDRAIPGHKHIFFGEVIVHKEEIINNSGNEPYEDEITSDSVRS
jgi:hypothetical protein